MRLLILEHGRWSMIDKYQTLMKGLSIDALSAFVTAFKSQLFVEGLVQGNFTSRVSAALAAAVLPVGFSTRGSAASVLAVWSSFTSNTSGVLVGISQWQSTVASLNRSFQEFGLKCR